MRLNTLFVNFISIVGLSQFSYGEGDDSKAQTTECSTKSNDGTCVVEQPQCKFYLAPSSIPNAGFGVYTTEALKKDELLMKADAPSVMVYDGDTHYPTDRLWSMEHYFWSGEGSGQFECSSVEEYVVTFGTSCNFHTYLKSIRPEEAEYYDSLTPRGEGSPGIGAYSYHGGVNFYATRDIEAGEEIFADYGEDWLDSRKHLGDIPREEDFDQAGKVLLKLMGGLNDDDISDKFLQTIQDVVKLFNSRVSEMLLPETKDDFKDLLKRSIETSNGTISAENVAMQLAFNTLSPRNMDWIKSEGKCLDNLVKKPSTLPHAGMGAFAQRFIPKGETVIIAPLLHIMESDSTLIYPMEYDEEENEMGKNGDDPIGTQLIVNYCYGHEDSTMLLCPQTNAMLINHCSERYDYGGDCARYNQNEDETLRGPNAEIRWATEWDKDTENWLKMSFAKMRSEVKKGKRGLSFEVVATRDIFPGDEVFLDYGEEWEADWQYHVNHWKPPSAEDYIPLEEMRKSEYFLTVDELKEEPYPENVMTMCHYWVEDGEEYDENDEDREATTAEYWVEDGSEIAAAPLRSISYWPCEVLSREEDEDSNNIYEVEIFQSLTPGAEETVWYLEGHRRILQNYSQDAIHFITRSYMSDQHVPGVFRSSLRIPDEMFPDQWRNH